MHVLVDEPLVVAEVEIGLSAVLGHEHLAVLERIHGPRVDVDIGVQLLDHDPEATRLEESPEGGRGDALSKARHHATRHENVLRHQSSVPDLVPKFVPAASLRPREHPRHTW
jgi:hypothetical protein